MDAWNVVDPSMLSRNFMTLQAFFQEVIRSDGNNNYKIPHLKKSMLMAQGKLPECLPCDRSVWADGCSKLSCVDFDNLMSTLQVEVNAKLDLVELCNVMEALNIDDEADDGFTVDVMKILQL
ncbi:hypothetical protein DYB32_006163 [Aphanomyces invadans]|nr:hypothetical protein DYB32_006163 [Aphanomyces invadans]